ncbi:MAG: tetratricopeptide repeat protein, partial [Candidatus Omnitrophica bacterium]|nr:tetratricopeptide repeat protein [Candidatus Omnitrophota bacterium]
IALIIFIRNMPRNGLRANAAAFSGSIFCFFIALLSKEIAVTLPLILLLYCVYALPARERLTAAFKTLPYFGAAALYMIVKFPFLAGETISGRSQSIGVYSHALVVLKTFAYYLSIMISPINLNAERRIPVPKTFFAPGILWSFALFAAIIAIIMISRKRGKLFGFALIWILVTLLPSSNIILLYPRPIAEQRLYLPSIGFCLALALIINRLFRPSSRSNTRKKAALCALSVICLTAFYSALTMKRNLDWRDPVTFWTKTSKSAPYKDRAYYNLGCAYVTEGKTAEAIESFKKTVSINPNHAEACYNLGNAYYKEKLFDQAIACFERAIEIDPKYVYARRDLNVLYQVTGRTDEAIAFYKRMLKVYPRDGSICNNLAIIYEENLGKHAEAIELYKKAISFGLNTEIVYYNLGVAYDSLNMEEEAMESYKKAIRLKPDFAEAYNNIAAICYRQGRHDLAARFDAKAKKLKEPTSQLPEASSSSSLRARTK